MINLWEAVQGVGFMFVLGLITRSVARKQPSEPGRSVPADAVRTPLPSPREAAEEQERVET